MASKTVFVLDDDAQIVEALGIILRSYGYEVQMETDPTNIESKVETCKPDIIVLDIRLPNASGLDISEALKSHPSTSSIPIILISARVGELAPDQLHGADLYLSKPFRMRELLSAVENLLAQSST